MATSILTNCKCYLDGYNLSGSLNQMALDLEVDTPENTCFGSTSRTYQTGGLISASFNHKGFWQAGTGLIDQGVTNAYGLSKVVTICPYTGAEGEAAFAFNAITNGADLGGSIGDMAGIGVKGSSAGRVIRGTIMRNAQQGATGGAVGTAFNVGACSATQNIYAALNVYGVSGTNPNLVVSLYSDSAENFSSTSAAIIAFTANTAIGSEWKTATNAVSSTDSWWRIGWVITGTNTPLFDFIVTLAIA